MPLVICHSLSKTLNAHSNIPSWTYHSDFGTSLNNFFPLPQLDSFLTFQIQANMDVKQAFEYFILLERQFWKNLDKSSLDVITFKGELKPEEMLLYGEFGFMLVGLKPAVLIEFCDEKVNILYLETVIHPVLFALKEKAFDYHIIKEIKTPESNLHGCLFVYNKTLDNHDLSSIISNTVKEVSEDTMATILDYPGSLPKSEKDISTMLSVMFFHDRPNNKGLVLLTSFVIQVNEKEKTLDHFKNYQKICKNKLNIDLKLLMQ